LVAARTCFADWFNSRGGTEPAEVLRDIARLRAFVSQDAARRFARWESPQDAVRNCAGFKRVEDGPEGFTYFLYPRAFQEACEGIEVGVLARALAKKGMLEPGLDGKPSKVVRIPGMPPTRFYVVLPRLLVETGNVLKSSHVSVVTRVTSLKTCTKNVVKHDVSGSYIRVTKSG
jgi:hypothetical protein